MASSEKVFDVPATYLRAFSVDQQKSLQRLLGYYTNQAGTLQYLAAANGALPVDGRPVVITKTGTLAALTLAAPTAAQNGMVKVITSATALAHTVTATGLFDNGVTGGAKNTATFAAFAGASMTVMAYNGKWHVIALNAVTVA
jgi:hypothetical protein